MPRRIAPTTFAMIMFACCIAPAGVARPEVVVTENGRRFYKGREIAQTMHCSGAAWLVRPSREKEEHCRELLEILQLEAGQTVCDFGCGNGFYTLRLARQVAPQGKVLAVDIQQQMLDLLAERASDAGVTNIVPVLATTDNPGLPPRAVDLVLMVDVYHELSDPEPVLRAVRTSLKPQGRLVLVEFRAEDPSVPIKPLHKMSKKQILKELVPNGFRLTRQYDGLPWQHVMFFRAADRAESRASQEERTP